MADLHSFPMAHVIGIHIAAATWPEQVRAVDEVAYLRFASVYKEFSGASDFEREMAAMEDGLTSEPPPADSVA